ncbi:MAG: DUF1302 domain-containing protein [Desulfobacterales bacterium]|nr:DUF1302 domain-containing protein [Desulfobacterales bacterium]
MRGKPFSGIRLPFALLFALCILFAGAVPAAAGEAGLDEILEGFDERAENAEETDPTELDDALDGFDEPEKSPGERSGERSGESSGDEMDPVVEGSDETAPPADPSGVDDVMDGFDEPGDAAADAGDDETDAALDGFDEPAESTEETEKTAWPDLPGWVELDGSLKLTSSYSLKSHRAPPWEIDLQGLSTLRTEANLEADFKLPASWRARIAGRAFYDWVYRIRGRDNFTDDLLDESESEAEFGEVYILGSPLGSLDLKVGRQIVVWGVSESLRIVDVANSLDQREPGMVDIEYMRLPAAMTRLDYFPDNHWSITGLMIHEVRFNKEPPFGSDYYPGAFPPPKEDAPDFSLENQQYAVAATGRFSGWDLSFHGAYYFNDAWHLEPTGPYEFRRRHARLTMVGATMDVVLGNWILKAETGWFHGLKFSNLPGEKKSRFDLLVGVEYSGFDETTISLEALNRHLLDHEEILENAPDEIRENTVQTALRITRDFRHDTIHFTLVAMCSGVTAQYGAFERAEVEYEVTDAVSATLGVILYQGGDHTMIESIKNNDRVFFELEYSF